MTIKHDNEKAAGEYLAEIVYLAECVTICPPDYHSDLIRAFLAGCAYRDRWWAESWGKLFLLPVSTTNNLGGGE